jgi:KaiC/GvpD/RAD55 family RecA-like ATPase
MTRTIRVDIDGLNMILGGGVAVLKRHETFDESAMLLVRGPPGSGKTVFGTQLAGSLARVLGCDVAYGCVELLPSELAAQHAGVKRPEVKERVLVAPFNGHEPRGEECRIFAEVLDLGSSGEEPATLGEAIEHLFTVIADFGGKPRVLVIDSLSDGYNLGLQAPREVADSLCKLAARRGIILILLEETVDHRPSAWSFACDVVAELSMATPAAQRETIERSVTITKNRLGPCEPGPHSMEVFAGWGIQIYPAHRTYLRPWVNSVLFPEWKSYGLSWQWGQIHLKGAENRPAMDGSIPFYPFCACTTLVYGQAAGGVALIASIIGEFAGTAEKPRDVMLSFGIEPAFPDNVSSSLGSRSGSPPVLDVILLGTLTAPDKLVTHALSCISNIWTSGTPIGRVFIGDLRWALAAWPLEKIREPLGVLLAVFRRAAIPTILMESNHGHMDSSLFQFSDVAVRTVGNSAADLVLVHDGIRVRVDVSPSKSDLAEYLLMTC